jgi:hypothetical protein
MNGVPCFRLSLLGTVVAASLDEIDVEKWIELLQQYLGDDSIVQQIGRDTKDEILSHLESFQTLHLNSLDTALYNSWKERQDTPWKT